MAQATILAAGITAATSTDIVLAAGASATVGLFSASAANLPPSVAFAIVLDTPGADTPVVTLTESARVSVIAGPGTFRVKRPAYTGTAFGVFTES